MGFTARFDNIFKFIYFVQILVFVINMLYLMYFILLTQKNMKNMCVGFLALDNRQTQTDSIMQLMYGTVNVCCQEYEHDQLFVFFFYVKTWKLCLL